ncbi:MAG: aldose epimerase [Tardiphaga sp.]|nr:aldose epimerase [Tardiphaga sp.]
MDRTTISNGSLSATIKAAGAELCSLLDEEGHELIWQAGPAWPRHAPILFPIVGRLKNDVLHHRGKTYPMKQHGFARDLRFAWSENLPDSCTLSLHDSEATHAQYPFPFQLDVTFALHERSLTIVYDVTNKGDVGMPASIGAHPAFNWPLASGADKSSHTIVFSQVEAAPIRRVSDGLLRAQTYPTPVQGTILPLSETLFVDDAVIFEHLASRSLRYDAPGQPGIEFSWQGFRELGLWSKPTGAPFLCIEPWHGFASPADFDGEFDDKPGLMHLAAGETRSFSHRVTVG